MLPLQASNKLLLTAEKVAHFLEESVWDPVLSQV